MVHLIAVATYLQTHVLSVVLAFLATTAIGFLWYGPLFGKQWMKYNGMTPPKKEDMKFSMMLPGIGANLAQTLAQVAVIGRSFEILFLPSIAHAFIIATLLWVPFTGLVMLNNYTWSGKPFGHFVIDAVYTLVSLWAVAAVLYVTL